MLNEFSHLFKYFKNPILHESNVIPWSSPIISFGKISTSKIATLGINPSNREFVDINGNELNGNERRFHTLDSLGLKSWDSANEIHFEKINQLCEDYFTINPYDGWFKKLDYLISGTSMSYYFPSFEACHLDLIPFATALKWSDLTNQQRLSLLDLTSDILGLLIKKSSIKVLILNGQTVVENLQKVSNIELSKELKPEWKLNRKKTDGVAGYSYTGVINKIGHIKLDNDIRILGFNHNIQSSFGVSSEVQTSIRNWITEEITQIFSYETN